jgi:15-cis-phytoene synthase
MPAVEQPEGAWTHHTLPRPFLDAAKDDGARDALNAAYDWHQCLRTVEMRPNVLEDEASRLESGQSTQKLSADRVEAIRPLVSEYDADPADFAAQIRGAAALQEPLRFKDASELDAFVEQWTAAHARVMGAVAGIGAYSWQRSLMFEISRGFFLTGALMTLKQDLEQGHLLFPLSDAAIVGMNADDLFSGAATSGVRRFLWKQVVRARDSFAQSQRLIDDLDRRQAAAFRRWWFASLEVLNQIEKHDFDVWNHPPKLSLYHRAHVRFQARFSRTTFR